VRETQAVKQADVVLLTWLLEGRIDEAVRRASFRYYEPRTAHSSSLSPGIHALVAARLGDVALAERYFRQTREIDLANNMGNAAGGVHLAALGSLWQAAIFGFAGVTVERRGISFAPALPPSWRRMRFALKRCGRRLGVTVTRDTIEVGVDEDATVGPVAIRAGRVGERVLARPGWRYIARRAADGTWRRFEEVGRS
jgi:kojibiose phosphorylase